MQLNKDAYKQILLETDPLHKEFIFANTLVEKYIREKGLIIYGGTAIDFSLRLKGKALYPDFMLDSADYDFLSPDYANDAYNIVDMLVQNGFKSARALSAIHVGTMKVDMVDNHWIADISYIPAKVFGLIKFLTYKGLRIIHPDFQKIDMHRALSFPYDGAPKEVIFDRWKKDIARYNLYEESYPIEISQEKPLSLSPMKLEGDFIRAVMHGFAAYSFIYADYLANSPIVDPTVMPAEVRYEDGALTFDTLENTIDVVSIHPEETLSRINSKKEPRTFRPLINLMPRRVVLEDAPHKYIAHDTSGSLLSVVTVTINGRAFRVACVQYVMRWFLAMSILAGGRLSNTYKIYYASLLKMIKTSGGVVTSLGLSIKTYGDENDLDKYKLMESRIRSELYKEKMVSVVPPGYRGANGARPTFEYENELYHNDGEEEESGKEKRGGGGDFHLGRIA